MAKFHVAMVRSAKARRLYTQIVLVLLLLFHYVFTNGHIGEFGVVLSTIVCAVMFSSKRVDKWLRYLLDRPRAFAVYALVAVVIGFVPHLYTSKLAGKQEKLQIADKQLSDLKENMNAVQERTEELKEEAYKYSRDVHSKVDSLLKDAMLEEMVNEHRNISARLELPQQRLFSGTLVQSVAERGTEVMHCATLLFLGMVDDATTLAETHGGGGGGNDLKWGRDEDEDNRAWALRCMRMACRMMRPVIGKKTKR